MDATTALFVKIAATVTATAATGTALAAIGVYQKVHRHERALFGEDFSETWDGIFGEVQANKKALEEEGIR